MSLISDAIHNLGDIFCLLISWGANYSAKILPTMKKTYGYRRLSILASLTSSLILVVALGGILWESILRCYNPQEVSGKTVMFVSFIAVIINFLSAYLFINKKDKDLNIKSAYLHLLADGMVSLGILFGGFLIYLTNIYWLDPLISIIVVLIILKSTWTLLCDSFHLAIDGVPNHIDSSKIKGFIKKQDGILDIHDLHIWSISTSKNALTAHIVMNKIPQTDDFLQTLIDKIKCKFDIHHTTIQIENRTKIKRCSHNSDKCV